MLTEAALLREVARVQHDKTLQAVRDVVDGIKVTAERSAKEFRTDLIAALVRLREDA